MEVFGRQILDRGKEHIVFRSQKHFGHVLKIPTPRTLDSIRKLEGPIVIAEELLKISTMIATTTVQIPETRIFIFPSWEGGYVLRQRFIEEDNSVNIKDHLNAQRLQLLTDEYDVNPENFRSYQGVVYYLDPFWGPRRIWQRRTHLPFKYIHKITVNWRKLKQRLNPTPDHEP